MAGCRCRPCTYASAQTVVKRDAEYRAARARIGASGNGPPVTEVRKSPRGTKTIRYSENTCPGIHGELCPHGSILRKDSSGGVCGRCGQQFVREETWRGLVDAAAAREHILALAEKGVGYKSVADAALVAMSTVFTIKSGRVTRIKAQVSQAILEVDEEAIADYTLVDAAPSWRIVRKLMRRHDYTKKRIAEELGQGSMALQMGKKQVLAKTAHRLEKLWRDAEGEFLRR